MREFPPSPRPPLPASRSSPPLCLTAPRQPDSFSLHRLYSFLTLTPVNSDGRVLVCCHLGNRLGLGLGQEQWRPPEAGQVTTGVDLPLFLKVFLQTKLFITDLTVCPTWTRNLLYSDTPGGGGGGGGSNPVPSHWAKPVVQRSLETASDFAASVSDF